MKNQAHPIVVVKRRRHKPHGGGAHGSWKIAYADFMTAMMAFFSGDVADFHLQP
ncbi:motility protein B [Salmonella sp. NCTC 11881]|nr:Signal transduction histidine kinase CheA [Salmonella enterica]VUC82566.1 motility protein B [Salmonella sp. NCTC 11881]